MAQRPFTGPGNPLFRKGPLIDLVREGPHPRDIARTARRIVAGVELARDPDTPTVADRLVRMGIGRTQRSAQASLLALRADLQPKPGILNNLYLHVTFRCQLHCTHCYAHAGADGHDQPDMPVEAFVQLVREAKAAGFRQVVITGGEPLVHHDRDELLPQLAACRAWAAPMNLVLRTNLAMPLSRAELRCVAAATDQVVVSVDGTKETHDARRGRGSYAAVVSNLEPYVDIANELASRGQEPADLSLACVMRSCDIQGEPGENVRRLADRLGVRRVRFRPLLPLGRASDWSEPPTSEALGAHADPMDMIEGGFRPIAACGLGQNLYVEPLGQSFPCYAYHRPHAYLGNVIEAGLQTIVDTPAFRDLCRHNVDTNPKCRQCEFRYLCGGACRAWGGDTTQHDLDTPPPECDGLRARAVGLYRSALLYLGLGQEEHEGNVPGT